MYGNINTMEQLRARVGVLQQQQTVEWKEMKDRVHDQYERLKPANLIRNAVDGLTENLNFNPEGDMLRDGAALVSGMVVNTIMSGSKNKTLKKTLSIALFSVAMFFITKHREDILNAGSRVMEFVNDRINLMRTRRAARKARKEAEAEEEEDYDEVPDFPEEDE